MHQLKCPSLLSIIKIAIIGPTIRKVLAHECTHGDKPAHTLGIEIALGSEEALMVPEAKGNHDLLLPIVSKVDEVVDALGRIRKGFLAQYVTARMDRLCGH
jgi:hypothetical protein